MNFCTKCGNQLKPEARFCGKCGQVVSILPTMPLPIEPETSGICSQCGNSLNPGSKFCVSCGKPVTIGTESQNPAGKGMKADPGNTVSGNKQKLLKKPGLTNNRYVKPAAVILLVIVCIAVGFIILKPGGHKLVKELLHTKMVKPADSAIFIEFDKQISVGIPFGELDKEREMKISKVSGFPVASDDIKVGNAYEITINGMTEFDGYLEIQLKYDPSQFIPSKNINSGITCMYYNEKSGEWEPVAHEINPSSGSATIYTKHLSVFGIVQEAEQIQPGPRIKLPSPRFPGGNLMSREQMTQVLRNNMTQSGETTEALKEGWSVFLDNFGLSGAGFDFVENVLEIDQISEVNGILGKLGLGFALAQAALDMSNDNQAEAVLGLTKEFVNAGIKNIIFETRAMNIAMIGVFAIDYPLSNFAETAVSGRNEIYQKAYRNYYKERKLQNKENSVWWNKKLKKLINNINDPKQINEQIDNALNEYVWYFWSDEQLVAQYQEQAVSGHAWTGGGGLSEKVKSEIAEAHLYELRQSLDVVFKKLIREMRLDYLGKLHENMVKATKKLNQEHTIIVRVKKGPNSDAYQNLSMSGLDVNIDATNPAHKGLWKGKTDSKGEFAIVCTLMGYVHAGSPKTVTVEIADPSGQNPNQTFQGNLKLSKTAKTTKVEIIIGGGSDDNLGGTWSVEGVCTSVQYKPGFFMRPGYTEAEAEALRIEEQNSRIGKSEFLGEVQFVPDYLNINTYETYTEGGFNVIKINSSGSGMGDTYRLRLTSNSTIEGTLERKGAGGISIENYNIKAKKTRD